jgi:hypothetical protein
MTRSRLATLAYLIRNACSEAENDRAREGGPVAALPQVAQALLRKPDLAHPSLDDGAEQ